MFHRFLIKVLLLCVICNTFLAVLPGGCRADTAEVLPKGVWNVTFNTQLYLPVHHKYDDDGDVELIAADYNDTLNSDIFNDLKFVEAAFGMPAGSANVGKSEVTFVYEFYEFDFLLGYGLTDRLAIGLKIPYWYQKNNVEANLDTQFATVGKNATYNTLLPLNVPGTVPLTTQDVINLLGRGLDINGDGEIDIPGYGYKKFGSWSDEGLSDIEGGFKYQYFKNKNWQLASLLAARFPTGQIARTDDLADYAFGTGAWGLIFALNNDYIGIKNLVLDATFRYRLFLPTEKTLRIPKSVNQPITKDEAEVTQDTGDIFEFELAGSYKLNDAFSLWALYRYGFSLKDEVSGPPEFDYSSLEDETDYAEHVGIIGVSYSTIPLFQAKKFPLPITAGISYRNRFAGRNTLKSQYFGFGLSLYF